MRLALGTSLRSQGSAPLLGRVALPGTSASMSSCSSHASPGAPPPAGVSLGAEAAAVEASSILHVNSTTASTGVSFSPNALHAQLSTCAREEYRKHKPRICS